MALIIPLSNDTELYQLQVELDGVTYGLELRWNHVAEGWFISVLTSEDVRVVSGVRIVVDWPLFKRFADPRLPPGELMAQDTTGAQQDPGLEDLGKRVLLLYFSEAEISDRRAELA